MQQKILDNIWLILAIVAVIIAALYAFVIPNSKVTPDLNAIQFFILRWLHSIVWVLLAIMFLIRAQLVPLSITIGNTIGYSALACYIIFMATLALAK
jgi:hypothetical protein